MKPTKGYYSLIQFCPDQSRLEAANVGVVLFCPELDFLEVRLAGDNSRIQRFFGKHAFNWSRINSYKQGIKERLEIEGKDFRGPEDLKVFGQRRGNNIQLTPPRPITVREPRSDLQQLFEEVVGHRKRSQDVMGFRRRFVEQLTRANLGPKLKRDIEIHVPSLNKEIDVPFGYQNGRFNLIQPVSFRAGDPAQLRRTASAHAIDGIALYEHADCDLGELELVVVGDFRSNAKEVREDIQRILRQGRTKLYTSQEVDDLIQEIRIHGKNLA
ncbi:MAG: DUF3037 domain-containing protein [Isosphaeraceae bacterium]